MKISIYEWPTRNSLVYKSVVGRKKFISLIHLENACDVKRINSIFHNWRKDCIGSFTINILHVTYKDCVTTYRWRIIHFQRIQSKNRKFWTVILWEKSMVNKSVSSKIINLSSFSFLDYYPYLNGTSFEKIYWIAGGILMYVLFQVTPHIDDKTS